MKKTVTLISFYNKIFPIYNSRKKPVKPTENMLITSNILSRKTYEE